MDIKKGPLLFVFLPLLLVNAYNEERSFLDAFIESFRILRRAFFRASTERAFNGKFQRALQERHKWQPILDDSVPFPCSTKNTRSKERPNSVHRLKPGDIDVIGAMGDSLSAGFGLRALTLPDILYESRELSFSGGGFGSWREHLTLPNILKEFNPNLIGYVKKPSLTIDRGSEFNVAEGGAVSDNMPYMSRILVQRIIKDPRVDVKKDWKMINFMIGPNDFCSQMCYRGNPEVVVDEHRKDLLEVLRYLKSNLPRTIVNIIPPPTLDVLRRFTDQPLICSLFVHSIACPCITGLLYEHLQDRFTKIMKSWQQIELQVADLDEFQSDDFAVVVQPLFLNHTFPKRPGGGGYDYSYLSEDCFHFSQKGGARVANSLWNNIMQPVGKKYTDTTETFSKFLCPTKQHPYIYTKKNS